MYRSYEFCIEVWPGEVRIHTDYETEDQQTIVLSAEQVGDFCSALQRSAREAKELGDEMQQQEAISRAAKARQRAAKGE